MGNGRYDPNATAGILPTKYLLGRAHHEARVDKNRRENKLTYRQSDVSFDGDDIQIKGSKVTCVYPGFEELKCGKGCNDFKITKSSIKTCSNTITLID